MKRRRFVLLLKLENVGKPMWRPATGLIHLRESRQSLKGIFPNWILIATLGISDIEPAEWTGWTGFL